MKKGVLGQTFPHFADICKFEEGKIKSIYKRQRQICASCCKNKCYVLILSSLPAPVDLLFFQDDQLSFQVLGKSAQPRSWARVVLTCKVARNLTSVATQCVTHTCKITKTLWPSIWHEIRCNDIIILSELLNTRIRLKTKTKSTK